VPPANTLQRQKNYTCETTRGPIKYRQGVTENITKNINKIQRTLSYLITAKIHKISKI